MLTRFRATAATLLTAAGLVAAADPKTAEMPVGLRIAFDQAVHKVERDGTGHKAYNPKQQYGMSFQESAASVRVENGELRMQLSGWGRRLAMQTPAAPAVSAEGNRLQYRRGEITEWYINDARGLEQGFTLNARPAGGGPLAVALKVTGDWTPRLEPGAEVVLERGGHTALRYGGLKACDAAGRPLPSRMEVEGREIRLMVDDAEARYPVTVDPLIQRAKLTANVMAGDWFGCAAAVSSDTAVVGACGYNNYGSAYIFVRTGNTWSVLKKLTASDGPAPSQFGASVAISGDTVVIGANLDSSSTGSAYVFVRSAGIWSQQQKPIASDHANGDLFGNAVAVDGDTAVIGAPGDDGSMGSMYIFTRAGSTWSQTQKVVAVTRGSNYHFGAAVALEGGTLAAGEYGYTGSRGRRSRKRSTWRRTSIGPFTINDFQPIDDISTGALRITFDYFATDPNAPDFDPDNPGHQYGQQVSARASVGVSAPASDAEAPEPSSLLLFGLGLGVIGAGLKEATMRRICIAMSFAACLAAAALSAAVSSFEGTWTRDAERSAPVGGKVGGPGRDVQAVTLRIEDRDGVFQVTRTVSFGANQAPPLVQRFPLDGKLVTNPAPAPGGRRGSVQSKASRDGARIVVEGVQQIPSPGRIEVKITDIYEVSADGKTLTVTTTRTNPEGTQTGKQVYRKD